MLAAGLTGLRDAVASADLDWTLPGAGLLLTGLGYALLTVAGLAAPSQPCVSRATPAAA